MKLVASKFVWGTDATVEHPLPLAGFPPGRTKIRIRPHAPVTVFVVSESVARHFLVVEKDGKWLPGPELARSITIRPPERKEVCDG